MFVRVKGYGPYRYLQIVENHREGKRTVQRALYTLGRVDKLMASGATDALLRSLARFGQQVKLVAGYQSGRLEAGVVRQMGPDLVFGRLWRELGIGEILSGLLGLPPDGSGMSALPGQRDWSCAISTGPCAGWGKPRMR